MVDMWNIRGVSEGSRRIAKGAAGAAGLTIGKWLEAAIALADGIQKNHAKPEDEEILIPPGPDIEPRKRSKKPKYTTCNHGATYGTVCQFCPDNVAQEAKDERRS
jgi:hypothetical protein